MFCPVGHIFLVNLPTIVSCSPSLVRTTDIQVVQGELFELIEGGELVCHDNGCVVNQGAKLPSYGQGKTLHLALLHLQWT